MRRSQTASILELFDDGIGRKHYQGQGLQAREDPVSNQRLVEHCPFDYGWWG